MARSVRGGSRIALVICLALFGGACSSTPPGPPAPVEHAVLMWLKNPSSAADKAKLLRAAHSLRMMPGVVHVEAGRDIALPADVQDRSYDLAAVISFRDRAALERYEGNPHHVAALERFLRPLVRRYEVFDSGDR